jgi:hypothetical protein
MTVGTDFLVAKASLRETRVAPADTTVGEGQALLEVLSGGTALWPCAGLGFCRRR